MRKAYLVHFVLICQMILGINLLSAQDKGIKNTARVFDRNTVYTKEGKEIIHYQDSYALLIGIWEYTNGWDSFKRENIENDINSIEESLINHGFQVTKFFNLNSERMKDEIENFKTNYGFNNRNRLLFYFSGHGESTDNHTKGYLIPSDSPLLNVENEEEFYRRVIHFEKLKADAKLMRAKHVIFFFDSCFSGTILETRSEIRSEKMIHARMANSSRTFITAGKADQRVPEKSIFTPVFIRGIQGEADFNKDYYITGKELYIYIKEEVEAFNNPQNPQYGTIKISDYEGDIIFILEGKINEQLEEINNNAAKIVKILKDPKIQIDEKIIGIKDFFRNNNLNIPGKIDDEIRINFQKEMSNLENKLKEYRKFYTLARNEYDSKNFNIALNHIGEARNIDKTTESEILEELILSKLKKSDKVEFDAQIKEADQNFSNEKYHLAIDLYNKLLKKSPGHKHIIKQIAECRKRIDENITQNLPKEVENLDVDEIITEDKRRQLKRKEEENEWASWQNQFKSNFDLSLETDKKTGISANAKIEMWETLRKQFSQNNPYSSEDEQFHEIIKERIDSWNRDFGYLETSAYPFADLTIDGEFIGEVPPLRVIKLYKGEHIITLKKGDATITKKILIVAGVKITFSHKFSNE